MANTPEHIRTTISPGHYQPPRIAHTQSGDIIGSFGGDGWDIYCHSWAEVNRLVHAVLEFRTAWQSQMDADASAVNDAMASDAQQEIA